MTKTLKNIPKLASEEAERDFWATADSTEYVDWSRAQTGVFPNLKPTTKTISLRMPSHLLESIKVMAHKRDVPYQTLIKMLLAERIEKAG